MKNNTMCHHSCADEQATTTHQSHQSSVRTHTHTHTHTRLSFSVQSEEDLGEQVWSICKGKHLWLCWADTQDAATVLLTFKQRPQQGHALCSKTQAPTIQTHATSAAKEIAPATCLCLWKGVCVFWKHNYQGRIVSGGAEQYLPVCIISPLYACHNYMYGSHPGMLWQSCLLWHFRNFASS